MNIFQHNFPQFKVMYSGWLLILSAHITKGSKSSHFKNWN